MVDVERVKALLENLFPARGTIVSLERGSPWADMPDWVTYDATHGVRVILRLIIFDAEGGAIRDIKEQQVSMIPAAAGDLPMERVEAYFRGWVDAVAHVFSTAPSMIDTLMPHDLTAPKVLALKKCKTAEDFRDAFLVRSRLGRFLPA